MLAALLTVLLAGTAAPDDATVEKVIAAINASASRIDACVQRHLAEYPKADGVAKLSVLVNDKGEVADAEVETALEGARNLRPCLARAAKTWRLPPPQEPNASLSVNVKVAPGRSFRLLTPKEQAAAAAAREADPNSKGEEDEGFVNVGRFLPSGW